MPTEMTCHHPAVLRFPRIPSPLALGLPLCLMLMGCGGGDDPPLVPVSGIVTLDGQPLAEANVQFVPASGWGSLGRTDETGRYELLYRGREKGATPGRHQVQISTRIEPDGDSADPVIQQGREESVPAKYNAYSTLEADVEPGSDVELDFKLESGTTR